MFLRAECYKPNKTAFKRELKCKSPAVQNMFVQHKRIVKKI